MQQGKNFNKHSGPKAVSIILNFFHTRLSRSKLHFKQQNAYSRIAVF